MKGSTKWLASFMAAAMIGTSLAPAYAATGGTGTASSSASDLQGHWAASDIGKWMNNGVVSGYPDGTFHPNKGINRAELVTIINKVFGFTAASTKNFSDVSADSWYAHQLAIAKEAGYYHGFEMNQARATMEISRQDAVTLLARAFNLVSGENTAFASSFKDSAGIQKYAFEAVNAFAGTISGYPDGSFKPEGKITRAEWVTLLDHLVAGYYSTTGSHETAIINGSVVINKNGANLKGATINGNLYLAPGIGNGEVTLDGITVKGTTFVWGGGENTVTFNNANLGNVKVNRPDGLVRVVTTGTTMIDNISIDSKSRLELGTNTKVDEVTVNKTGSLLIASDASIANLTVNQGAAGTTIVGKGNIPNTIVRASGITVNGEGVSVGTIAVVNGVSVPVTPGAPTTTTNNGSGIVTPAPISTVDFVDSKSTAETKSLFAYLQDIRGKHILFGQQHATTEGMSITEKNGSQSDSLNAVGAYPAVFGWDTLSLEGKEKPGISGVFEQSRDNLIDVMKKAYAQNGVLNLSSHMPNFVTGGDFYDLKGNVVSTILPGGSNHQKYNQFLDNIADFATKLKTDDGKPIPVIFRPFHEQSGSWFWWGSAFTTKDEYKEIYRYTVEYLRDQKGVHNFLYAYSPGGGFGDNEEKYLETYPGDDYVDIIGFDSYYNGEGQGWFDSVVKETKLVSKIADQKNKVAALTEFGYQKMQISGNATPDFFTRLATALKSDPDSKRMAYMLTWANFGANSIYVPYPTGDPAHEHEMLADFKKYYDDEYSLFSNGVAGAYNRSVNAAVEKPLMHIASPTNQGTIGTSTTKVRARVLNETPAKVVYSVNGSIIETPMTLEAEGFFYSADWSPAAGLNGKMNTLTVKVYGADGTVLQEQTNTVFVKIGEVLIHSYTFDEDILGIQNNGGYQAEVSSLSHSTLDGNGVLELGVTKAVYGDNWQEMKLELTNAKSVINSDTLADVSRIKFDAWIPVSAGSPKVTASLRAVVMLPPDWDNKYGMETTQVTLSEMQKVTINGVEYAKFSPTIDLPDAAKREAASDIALSLVGSGLDSNTASFPVYIDNIQLYSTFEEATSDPAVVDDFEGYLGSNLSLQTKFVHAGGDIASVSLDAGHKHGGSYGLKYSYTLGGNGYTGITKSMGSADWSGFNALQFWYQPDAQGQKLVIQINASGKTYEYYPDTKTTTAQFVTAKFSDFKPANGATGSLTKLNLKAIQAFSIYTNAVPSGTTLTSDMYFDDIKAVNDPNAGTVPSGSEGGGIALGTLFNFESSLQDWVFGQNTVATNLANTTDGGSKVLSVDFPNAFPTNTNFEVNNIGNKDLSNGSTLKLKVRISSGSAIAKLFIKTGGGWVWEDSGEKTLTTDYQWIAIDLNQSTIDKTLIQSMGLQISSPSGTSSPLTVYVDDVILE